jgi:hypothetical protein
MQNCSLLKIVVMHVEVFLIKKRMSCDELRLFEISSCKLLAARLVYNFSGFLGFIPVEFSAAGRLGRPVGLQSMLWFCLVSLPWSSPAAL